MRFGRARDLACVFVCVCVCRGVRGSGELSVAHVICAYAYGDAIPCNGPCGCIRKQQVGVSWRLLIPPKRFRRLVRVVAVVVVATGVVGAERVAEGTGAERVAERVAEGTGVETVAEAVAAVRAVEGTPAEACGPAARARYAGSLAPPNSGL